MSLSKIDRFFVLRAIDDAMSELEAAVADGLVDEKVLEDLREAYSLIHADKPDTRKDDEAPPGIQSGCW